MVKINVTLLDKHKEVDYKIRSAIIKEMDVMISGMIHRLIPEVRKLVYNTLMSQPEVQSVANGELKHHFGLPDGDRRIEAIIKNWCNNIIISKIPLKYKSGKVSGGLIINVIQSDYVDVLGLPEASLFTNKGVELEWLKWLLLMGNRIIIRKYAIDLKKRHGSRSGAGLMVQTKRSGWRVPPQFSGLQSNNFVTRALDDIEIPLTSIINKELQKYA